MADPVVWDLSVSTNATLSLTANTSLYIIGATDGIYGTLRIKMATSGSTLTFSGGTHVVANGGGGALTLTPTADAVDIASFVFDDESIFNWNAGYNYT